MGRSTMIAALLGVPLASAFAVSGVAHSAFAPASGRLPLAPTHPACSTHARSVLASGAAPTLRGARGGLLGASAVEYSVIKGEETKNGGHKYIFTVTVAGDMSKDSYVTIMKDFKKNAQFPGFRKGTIPPFMLPKVKQFVILDCLEKTLSTAVKDEGLMLADDEVKPTLSDDQTNALTKAFKEADGFTYTIECELKPSDGKSGDEAAKSQSMAA